MRRQRVLTPPEVKDTYGDWTVYMKPLPKLSKERSKTGNKWVVPVQCSCGTKDIIDYQNLRRGRSTKCYRCALEEAAKRIPKISHRGLVEAFGEKKTLKEWVKDPRCVVSEQVLSYRVRCFGINNEDAMREPTYSIRTRTKITEEQAREVMLKAFSGHSGIALSNEYGLANGQITQLVHGKTYEWATRELMAKLVGQCWNDKQIFFASCYGRNKFPIMGQKFGCWTVVDKPHLRQMKGFREWLMPSVCECGNKAHIKKFCAEKGSVKCKKCGRTGSLLEE